MGYKKGVMGANELHRTHPTCVPVTGHQNISIVNTHYLTHRILEI